MYPFAAERACFLLAASHLTQAAFVDEATATSLGIYYVLFRALYGVAFTWYGHFNMLCEVCTQPNYMVIHYFMLSVLCDAIGHPLTMRSFPALFGLFLAIGFAYIFLFWNFPTGYLMAYLNNRANKVRKEGRK